MSSTVISIKPFQLKQEHRAEALYWLKRGAELLASGTKDPMASQEPCYTSAPVELPKQPHWIKRMYSKALDFCSISCRVPDAIAERLKTISGWQGRLRSFIYALTEYHDEQERLQRVANFDYHGEGYTFARDTMTEVINTSASFIGLSKSEFMALLECDLDLMFDDMEAFQLPHHIEFLSELRDQHKTGKDKHIKAFTTYYRALIKVCRELAKFCGISVS